MRIGIVSPSGPSSNSELLRTQFEQGIRNLESLGLEVVIAEHALSFHSYYSDTAEARVADLHRMYTDPRVDVILAANGGWPASHLLRRLDFDLIRAHRKPLIGFSDVSLLVNAIHVSTGIVNIHGPLLTWGVHDMSDETRISLCKALSGAPQAIPLQGRSEWLTPGRVEGRIIAGNLSTLITLIGTPWEPKWDGSILFWEEEAESTWTIDRMITHLENAGIMDRIAGMVVGQITDTNEVWDGGHPASLDDLLRTRLSARTIPVLRAPVFGHADNPNLCIPVGGIARLRSEALYLEFPEAEACASAQP